MHKSYAAWFAAQLCGLGHRKKLFTEWVDRLRTRHAVSRLFVAHGALRTGTPTWLKPALFRAGAGQMSPGKQLRIHNRWLLALALLFPALNARAMGGLILIDAPPKAGYTLAIGPMLAGYPEAPGSGHTRILPLVGVDFESATGGFISTDIGVGWNFSKREDLQFGARLWPVFGRTDDRSRARGLDDVRNRLGLGLFLNYEPWQFLVLQSSVLTGSGSNGNGTQFETGATIGAPLGDSVLLGLTLGTTWSNGAYLHSYFGVTPAESGRGSLPVFAPGAGRSDVNVSLSAEVRIDSRWKLTGQWLSARLIGDASRSPVTTSRTQNTFLVTLWYQLK